MVAHGLAAADFEGELEVGFTADFDQAESLVDAGALGFEFGFNSEVTELFLPSFRSSNIFRSRVFLHLSGVAVGQRCRGWCDGRLSIGGGVE
jgi:hypothetical protein